MAINPIPQLIVFSICLTLLVSSSPGTHRAKELVGRSQRDGYIMKFSSNDFRQGG